MKKKSHNKHNLLLIKYLELIFFFIFFLFSINSYSQSDSDSLNYLIRNDFNLDTLRADSFFVEGRLNIDNNDKEAALDNFLKCYYIRKNVLGPIHEQTGYAANRLGIINKDLGRLDDAIDYYQIVIDVVTAKYGVESTENAVPYTNLGNVYQLKGNLEDAIYYYEQGVELFEIGLKSDNKLLGNTLSAKFNLAGMYFQKNQYEKALELIINSYQQVETYWDKADFLNLLGNIYLELNDNIKAREYFNLSIEEMLDNELDAIDSLQLANLYIGYSDFLISMNEYHEAEQNLMSAKLLITDTVGRDISNLYYTFGNLFSKRKYDSNSIEGLINTKIESLNVAINYFQKAIIAISDSFLNTNPSANPMLEQCQFPANTLEILQKKSESFFELAKLRKNEISQQETDLHNSLSATNLASDLLDYLRTGVVNEDSKIAMTQMQNSIYMFSVKVAFELFNLTNDPEYFEIAFQNAERNKAASLLDNLTDENAREASFLPDSLIQKEENINNQISTITQKLYEENQQLLPDTLLLQLYNNQLFQLDREKKEHNRFLEENFKEYYLLKYAEDSINLNTLQKQLAKDETIIEYVLNMKNEKSEKSELYIFSVSKNDYSFQQYQVDSTFISNIDIVYQFLSASDFINIPTENYINYLTSANELYKTLIRPVKDLIKDNTVTIIPDGVLSYIPFDALLYNFPSTVDTLNFIDLDYLVKKYIINYSYSVNLYLTNFNTDKRAGKKLLAFAPDYSTFYSNADPEFNQLPPLTGIMQEVSSISKYIKSNSFIKQEATESNFKKNMADYDILHLAMHAIINDSLPMFSKLAFTPEQSDSIFNDGWLYTSEIYNMKLNARLSVLSACNTGSGRLREGEGVISLARGFFYAGCPSIVMTLWEVQDRSGADIMANFYKFLKAGKKKHEALRLAKLKHLENANPVTAHPHVWLSYVNIGNTDALNTSNDFYFFVGILLILVFILIDQILRIKKARKNRAG